MFRFAHYNFNVLDLQKSIAFYKEALGFDVKREKLASDGSFKLVYLTDKTTGFELELTWLSDRKEPYSLGENEFHLAVTTTDYDAAYRKHMDMGCICYENTDMGLYFINDPDGYWIEIVREKERS